MIRMVVLIKVKADAPDGGAERLVEGVSKLPAQIPSIRGWEVGLGLDPAGTMVGVVGLFDDMESFARYKADPAHLRCAQTYIAPVMESATQIQFEVAGPAVMEEEK